MSIDNQYNYQFVLSQYEINNICNIIDRYPDIENNINDESKQIIRLLRQSYIYPKHGDIVKIRSYKNMCNDWQFSSEIIYTGLLPQSITTFSTSRNWFSSDMKKYCGNEYRIEEISSYLTYYLVGCDFKEFDIETMCGYNNTYMIKASKNDLLYMYQLLSLLPLNSTIDSIRRGLSNLYNEHEYRRKKI